jgi:hypothetical protein
MVKQTIGAQAPALTLVDEEDVSRPLGYPGGDPWDAPCGPADPQPFARMPVPGGPADVVTDPLAWTIYAYLIALQGERDAGLAHGSLALAARLGVSDDRWATGWMKIEDAGAGRREPSDRDRRSLVHIVSNPGVDGGGVQWVRVPLGLLIDCSPLGDAGAHPDAPRLWARIAAWQGGRRSTRQLETALARAIGCSRRTASRCVADLERLGWLRVQRNTGRHGHTYSVVDPTAGVTGNVLASVREAAEELRRAQTRAAEAAALAAVQKMRAETAQLRQEAAANEASAEAAANAADDEMARVSAHYARTPSALRAHYERTTSPAQLDRVTGDPSPTTDDLPPVVVVPGASEEAVSNTTTTAAGSGGGRKRKSIDVEAWLAGLDTSPLPGSDETALDQATGVVAAYLLAWKTAGRRTLTPRQVEHLRAAVVHTWTQKPGWTLREVTQAMEHDVVGGMQDWTRTLQRWRDETTRAGRAGKTKKPRMWDEIKDTSGYSRDDVPDRV